MYRRWIVIILVIIIGSIPAATLAHPSKLGFVPVSIVITWDSYKSYEYINAQDWCMYLDLRLDTEQDILTQTIETEIKPFTDFGIGQAAGPFTITWPGNSKLPAQMSGRVRWYASVWHIPEEPMMPEIMGDWIYIQDVTGTVTTLYFPLGIAPAQ